VAYGSEIYAETETIEDPRGKRHGVVTAKTVTTDVAVNERTVLEYYCFFRRVYAKSRVKQLWRLLLPPPYSLTPWDAQHSRRRRSRSFPQRTIDRLATNFPVGGKRPGTIRRRRVRHHKTGTARKLLRLETAARAVQYDNGDLNGRDCHDVPV